MFVAHNGGIKYTGIDPYRADPANQFRVLGESLPSIQIGDESSYIQSIGEWQKQKTGAMRALLVPFGSAQPNIYLERMHPDGPPYIVDAHGKRLHAEIYGTLPSRTPRNPEKMQEVMRKIEANKKFSEVHDVHGRKLCSITYDPLTGDIVTIKTEPYENIEGEAEHGNELVCITDDSGALTGEPVTRQEAREKKMRYLVVSLLLEHESQICVGRRSKDKKIDPGMEAISAHGVAKLLYREDGTPITDLRYATLVNTALELSEELRHGHGTQPFNVIVWPGSERELFMHAESHPTDDPNTVYLAGGMLFADQGYPLHADRFNAPRTRFIINGHVFAKNMPAISVDPYEVDGTQWMPMREFSAQPNLSDDSLQCARESYLAFLQSKTSHGFHHSQRYIRNAMNAVFDPDVPSEGRSD